MSFNYNKLGEVAALQISNFGRNVTLKRVTEPVYDYATGGNVGGVEVSHVLKAVVTGIEESLVNGGTIQRDDKIFTIAALGVEAPEIGDTIDGLRVLDVKLVHTGDTVLLYKAQVRS